MCTLNFRSCLLLIIVLYASAACQNPGSDQELATTEVAAYMDAFEGRGDLSDASNPLPPHEAVQQFDLPNDIAIDLLASEPLVVQPLELNFDHRGRLWVVQYKQYPYPEGLKVTGIDWHLRTQFDKVPAPPPEGTRGADTISLLEDTDGDGIYDHAEDVIQGLNIATSVTWGRGQIWVLNPPYLLAFPDPDGDGRPDGDPVVHLSGFGLEDTHAVANSLRWGPDGWLYGAQGSTTTATIQSENSPEIHFQGQAIWRYHPEKEVFELFAEGGGNTFHVEFDDKGRLYSGHNGGEARGQYYKQGGYYPKNWGKHGALTNPFALGYLDHMALEGDNLRFTHGFLRYGGDNLPARYQDALIGMNPLHNFVQVSRFEPVGSSFQTIDTERLLETEDHWFRPVDIKAGPDGGVYLADWYDSRLTHIDPRDTWHKSSGRIYRLRARENTTFEPVDFGKASIDELVSFLSHKNRWHRQQALRQFGDRKDENAIALLEPLLFNENGQTALEALWALHLSGGLSNAIALKALGHEDPFVRMWTIRLLGDFATISRDITEVLTTLAGSEQHPEVRSQLAASLKRWEIPDVLPALIRLATREDDIEDPHIPLQIWWAMEAHIGRHAEEVVRLFENPAVWEADIVQQVLLRRMMQRAIQSDERKEVQLAERLFELAPSEDTRRLLVEGFQEGLRGVSISELPETLVERYQQHLERLGDPIHAVGLRRGDEVASAEAFAVILDESHSIAERLAYIQILKESPRSEATTTLLEVVQRNTSSALRKAALMALRGYEQPDVGRKILDWYPDRLRADPVLKIAALELLAGRKEWAIGLTEAILDTRRIDKDDVPLHLVRQMQLIGNDGLRNKVETIWPSLAVAGAADRQQQFDHYRKIIVSGEGNAEAGKAVFTQHCGTCHALFDSGGSLGPNLTGYERTNLDAMLMNTVDPSAEIREGYVNYLVTTRNGNVFSGFMAGRRGSTVVIRSFTDEEIVLAESEIQEMQPQPVSLMPEGLLDALTEQQIEDLFAFIMQ